VITWHNGDQKSNSSTTSSLTIDRPDNVIAGNTIRAFIILRGEVPPSGITLPSGWRMEYVQWSRFGGLSSATASYLVASRVVGGDEPSNYTFTYDMVSTPRMLGVIGRLSSAPGTWAEILTSEHKGFTANANNTTQSLPGRSGLDSGDYLRFWMGGGVREVVNPFTELEVTSPSMTEVFQGSLTPASNGLFLSVYTDSFTGDTAGVIDSEGGHDNQAGNNFRLNLAQYVIKETVIEERASAGWFPQQDGADFGDPNTPEYESQKNMAIVRQDPRTGKMLMIAGGWGTFGEDPPTSQKVYISEDCNQTWQLQSDLADVMLPLYWTNTPPRPWASQGINWEDANDTIQGIIWGDEPGTWLIFNQVMDYWVSTDDGVTWSEKKQAGVGLKDYWTYDGLEPYFQNLQGMTGDWDTRYVPLDKQDGVIGVIYDEYPSDFDPEPVWDRVGVKRSVGSNGDGGWEESLVRSEEEEDKQLLAWPGLYFPILAAGNGRWIVLGYGRHARTAATDFVPETVIFNGNMIINDSPNLDPNSWLSNQWLISKDWVNDMYDELELDWIDVTNITQRRFDPPSSSSNWNSLLRLKFIPNGNHPAGGRWWVMGVPNVLVYSDDNGNTWKNTYCDHRGPIYRMHPMLNWRLMEAIVTRRHPPTVTDIAADPINGERLMSIGVTYDREGITNRLAVFSMSLDNGNSWSPVGQTSLTQDVIGSSGTTAAFDSPAIARHIFLCFRNGE